jgi:hypothetical protein
MTAFQADDKGSIPLLRSIDKYVMSCRLLFVGSSKIAESVITLQFDCFLTPRPNQTLIYLGSVIRNGKLCKNPIDLFSLYQQHGIDTSTFLLIHDIDILERHKQFALYDTFNFWIRQQLIKLMALDSCVHEQILIQDSDILITHPYQYFDNGRPVPMTVDDNTQPQIYYDLVKKLTGRPRQTSASFITEIMPVRGTDWQSLKLHIEHTFQQPWLTTITGLLEQQTGKILFSEYEILGNWLLRQSGITHQLQKKYSVTANHVQMIKNKNFSDTEYNAKVYNCVHFTSYPDLPRLDHNDIEYCTGVFMPGAN